jgi:hypothetical protein
MKEEGEVNETKALISLSLPIIMTIGFMILIFATIKKQ